MAANAAGAGARTGNRRDRRRADCAGGARGGRRSRDHREHPLDRDRSHRGSGGAHRAEIYLNVQGDHRLSRRPISTRWPLDARRSGLAMATLATPITDTEEWYNPNKVKVVCDAAGRRDLLLAQPDPARARRRAAGGWRAGISASTAIGAISSCASRLWSPAYSNRSRSSNNCGRSTRLSIRVVASVAPSLEVDTPEDLARANQVAAANP